MYYLDAASSSRLFKYEFTEDCNFNPNSQYMGQHLDENYVKRWLLNTLVKNPSEYNVYVYASCTQANQDIKNLGRCFTFEHSHPSLLPSTSSSGDFDVFSAESVVSETGEVLNIEYWSDFALSHKALFHLDITSSLMSSQVYDADIITFATYKLGIPIGLSFMLVRKFIDVRKLHYSKGTFPLLLANWFIASLKEARYTIRDVVLKSVLLKDILDTVAKPVIPDGYGYDKGEYTFWSKNSRVSPFICAYEFDVNMDILYPQIIKHGVLCSRGASCRNGEQSIAYKKLGCNPKNVLRFSINHLTTNEDIQGANIVKDLYRKFL